MNSFQTYFATGLIAVLALLSQSCSAQETALPGKEVAPGVRESGRIAHPRITESSGVVASRQFPGVLWTHTDGGGARKQVLVAMAREGAAAVELFVSDVFIAVW